VNATFADPGVGVLRHRLARARKLAAVLVEYGFDVEDAKLMDDSDWALAAKGAGIQGIPSPATRAFTIEEMAKCT
jgi:hypothetical protein